MVQRTKKILNPLFDAVRTGVGSTQAGKEGLPIAFQTEIVLVAGEPPLHETFAFSLDANENVSVDGNNRVDSWTTNAGVTNVFTQSVLGERPLLTSSSSLFNGSPYVWLNWDGIGSNGSLLSTDQANYGDLSMSARLLPEEPGSGFTIIAVVSPENVGNDDETFIFFQRYRDGNNNLVFAGMQQKPNFVGDYYVPNYNNTSNSITDFTYLTSSRSEVVALSFAFNITGSAYQDKAQTLDFDRNDDNSQVNNMVAGFISGLAPQSGSGGTTSFNSGSYGEELSIGSFSSFSSEYPSWKVTYMEFYHSRLYNETIQERIETLANEYGVTLRS